MIKFIPERVQTLRSYMAERESIRHKREDLGQKKPWTTDPLLRQFRFTNVRREDDKVTRWIKKNWRDPYDGHTNMVAAMLMARLVNWIPSLEVLGFPEKWDPVEFVSVMDSISRVKGKAWTGAYMITAAGPGKKKAEVVSETLDCAFMNHWKAETCFQMWKDLHILPRIGSFMAAQVVADLKHTSVLREAADREEFCAPGPGSTSGLNWVTGSSMLSAWNQSEFQEQVNRLKEVVRKFPELNKLDIDAQDMQNNLCELSKYVRGYSRTRFEG